MRSWRAIGLLLWGCGWAPFGGDDGRGSSPRGLPDDPQAAPDGEWPETGFVVPPPDCADDATLYRDVDKDGWGNAAALVCADDPGGVERGGDCDDRDEMVHPDAPDEPDRDYVDQDCDGVDGDEDTMLFVAVDGSDDLGDGTRDNPFATIPKALERATFGPSPWRIAVSAGRYEGAIVLPDGASIHGAYSRAGGWSRDPEHEVTIANAVPVEDRVVTVLAVGLVSETRLESLHIVAETTTAPDTSVIAIEAVDSPGLVLRDVRVEAGVPGNGSDGADGARGADGVRGSSGESGWCDDDTYTDGGEPGRNPACPLADGGRGGNGGGGTSSGSTGSASVGGAGGGSSGSSGNPGGDAGSGTGGAFGTTGAHGAAGWGQIIESRWLRGDGQDGFVGGPGVGGGGGGGGGGQDPTIGYYGTGSAGGGGGSGGCGGAPGTGGRGGGASVALYAVRSAGLRIERSTLMTSQAGAGGRGGAGGEGGTGGDGGDGPSYCVDEVGAGGDGGRGGNGGAGGAGGGGQGGASIAILCHESAIAPEDSELLPGLGGPGGGSPVNVGAEGLAIDRQGCGD